MSLHADKFPQRNAAFEETPKVSALSQAQICLLIIHFSEFNMQPFSDKQPFFNKQYKHLLICKSHFSALSQRKIQFYFLYFFSLDSHKHQGNQQQHNRITLLPSCCRHVPFGQQAQRISVSKAGLSGPSRVYYY